MPLRKLWAATLIALSAGLVSSVCYAQPTTVGLVSYHKFAGNMTNSGPANVTATGVSTTYTTNKAGTPNSAVQFGGTTSSYVNFVDNGNLDFSGATNFTVSFSFYFNGSTTSGLVDNCLNYNGWGVWLWSTVTNVWNIQFNYRGASVGSAASTAFTRGVWHHVAAVRNNGTISVYIDGAFRLSATEGTGTPSYPINMEAGSMTFASFTPPRYNPFGGKLDELRIYNRALSAAEIAVLHPYSLPLQLGNFSASRQSTGIALSWETLSEQQTSHFEIERSGDGDHFTRLDRVEASGTSTDTKQYRYLDRQPLRGANFYRLKMMDLDGSFTYSKVVAVRNEADTRSLVLYPNPVADLLQVQLRGVRTERVSIRISDMAGRQVYTNNLPLREGDNFTSIPTREFPPGNYLLTVQYADYKESRMFNKR